MCETHKNSIARECIIFSSTKIKFTLAFSWGFVRLDELFNERQDGGNRPETRKWERIDQTQIKHTRAATQFSALELSISCWAGSTKQFLWKAARAQNLPIYRSGGHSRVVIFYFWTAYTLVFLLFLQTNRLNVEEIEWLIGLCLNLRFMRACLAAEDVQSQFYFVLVNMVWTCARWKEADLRTKCWVTL